MWFEEDDLIGKRLFMARRKRRKAMLKVNARVNSKGLMSRFKVAVLVSAAVAVVGSVGLAWWSIRTLDGLMFSENDRFKIAELKITIRPGVKLTKSRVEDYARIHKGMNIFAFDIKKVRSTFLKHQPNVKRIEIRRRLPDVVEIDVEEREALARLGRNGSYGVDEEGFVFVLKPSGILPVLEGGEHKHVTPGTRLSGRSLAALRVVECCKNNLYGINIKAVNVDKREYLVLYLMNGKSVDFNWLKMGTGTEESRQKLMKALRRLSLLLNSDEGRKMRHIDATYGSKMFAKR